MKKTIIGLLLLPALIAGCSKDINIIDPSNTDRNISFCTDLEHTRAAITEEYFPQFSEIGIFGIISTFADTAAIDGSGVQYELQEYLNNGKYIASSISEKGTQALLAEDGKTAKFPSEDDGALVFYAYHPYNQELQAENSAATALPSIPIVVREKMEDTPDYLYSGKKSSGLTVSPVALKFKHAMARLDILIKKANEEGNTEIETDEVIAAVTKIVVTTRNPQKGEMSITDGTITSDNDKPGIKEITYELEKALEFTSEEKYVDTGAKFLLIPEEDAIEKVEVWILRTDAEAATAKYIIFDQPTSTRINLEKGKITTLRLSYNPKEFLSSATIDEWADYEMESEDEYDFGLK